MADLHIISTLTGMQAEIDDAATERNMPVRTDSAPGALDT